MPKKDKYGEQTGRRFQDANEEFADSKKSREAAEEASEEIEGGEPEDMKAAERRGREPARGGRSTE